MADDLMTLRDLRVQTFKERREGRLTKLPLAFYNRMKKLESQIRQVIESAKDDLNRFEKANADIRKFMDMKLELHKHRERKLTDLAREKVNGQSPDTENAHKTEMEYLVALCGVIEKHRKNTLLSKKIETIDEEEIKTEIRKPDILKTESSKPEIQKTKTSIPETKPSDPMVADTTEPEKVIDNDEYIKVKVLETLPTFTGMDANNYTLKNEDITEIPIYNAKILRDAGKVEIMKEAN